MEVLGVELQQVQEKDREELPARQVSMSKRFAYLNQMRGASYAV